MKWPAPPSPLTQLDAALAGLRSAPLMQRPAVAESCIHAARNVLADLDGRLRRLEDAAIAAAGPPAPAPELPERDGRNNW